MNAMIAWLVAFMVAVAPTTRQQFHADAKESPEDGRARYESIASDIVSVVYNPSNLSLFRGQDGRARTASIVMGIMFYESSFRRDVDLGLGSASRGDGGRSWCLMQVKIDGKGARTATWNTKHHRFKRWNDDPADLVEGWTGPELVSDRRKCIEAGYRIMSSSFAVCGHLPVPEWLRAYASGNCDDDGGGAEKSEQRMNFGINWYNRHRPTFTDSDIISELFPTQFASNP